MQNTRLTVCDETSLFEQGTDNGMENNWTWSGADKEKWQPATDECQEFYKHWHNDPIEFHDEFPYQLSLGVDSIGRPLLPFHPHSTSGNRILVTKAYNDMFHRLLYLRWNDMGRTTGAVITGQPGIGKTTFLKFMLARLIQAGQVVLLCDASRTHLFYKGQAYSRSTVPNFDNLPIHLKMPYYPIWALIDVDHKSTEPPISTTRSVWPIQTSSPNPTQWKSWRKQYGAALLGLPLWDTEELMQGLCLLPEYNDFRSRLEKLLPLLDGSILSTTGENEDRGDMGESISTSAMDQGENAVDEADVDNALKILVRNATEEFGFAPRDVYNGVLELPETREQHAVAVGEFNSSKLKAIVEKFSWSRELDDFSHYVVALYPRQSAPNSDSWEIDFKSIRIAREVVESMRLEDVKHLQETYHLIRKLSEGSPLAGWVFKAIVHRILSGGSWSGGPMSQPIRMISDGRNPPALSMNSLSLSSIPDASMPPPTPLCIGTRTVTRVNFTHKLSNVTLDTDRYYIPTGDNHPLFDSFTIDLDLDRHIVVISVFRIPISPMHEGSAKDDPLIRKILAHVCELLRETDPEATVEATVKVAHFLVCPED